MAIRLMKDKILQKFKESKKISETVKLVPFTKIDFYEYSGASKLPDGSGPFLYSGERVDVVVSGDDSGGVVIEVGFFDNDLQGDIYSLKVPTKGLAFLVASVLSDSISSSSLEDLGFKKIS